MSCDWYTCVIICIKTKTTKKKHIIIIYTFVLVQTLAFIFINIIYLCDLLCILKWKCIKHNFNVII